MRPSASAPITTAAVGVTRFTRPQADWKAVTTTSPPTPANCPSGATTGTDSVARPEEDGISTDNGR